MKVIEAIISIVLVVIVYAFLFIALYKLPWIGERILNKLREWAEMPLEDIGLLLHLDENSGSGPGTKVMDSSGWENHGTFGSSSPIWGADKTVIWGGSLVFDTDNYVEVWSIVKNRERLNPNSTTIEFWIKRLTDPPENERECWRNILSKGISDPSYQVRLSGDLSIVAKFKIGGAGEGSVKSDGFVPKSNKGTHVAITYDNSTGIAKIIINGFEDKSLKIGPGEIKANDEPLIIGNLNLPNPSCTNEGKSVQAVLDEIRIYNKALDPFEIVAHYQNLY